MRRGMVFKLGATYVGTVVGAGFASGQEYLHFFGGIPPAAARGVALSGTLFVLFGALLADIATRRRTSSPEDLFRFLLGPPLYRVVDALVIVFMFCSVGIMFAGSGALARVQLGLPREVGILATCSVVALATASGVRGLLSVNALMSPPLVATTMAVAALSVVARSRGHLGPPGDPSPEMMVRAAHLPAWPLAAILYVSYNLLLVAAVFASMGDEIQDASTARLGGALGGAVLALFLEALRVALTLHGEQAWRADVPMLVAAAYHGALLRSAYSLALWCAMVTTALAGAFSLSRRLEPLIRAPRAAVALLVAIAPAILARRGFAALVGSIYPAFGYLGLPLIACVLIAYLRVSGQIPGRPRKA